MQLADAYFAADVPVRFVIACLHICNCMVIRHAMFTSAWGPQSTSA